MEQKQYIDIEKKRRAYVKKRKTEMEKNSPDIRKGLKSVSANIRNKSKKKINPFKLIDPLMNW